jgi:uncharacterized protein (TIGR00299 family) protein
VIDATAAGISGDMMVSAAIDMGASKKAVLEAMLSTQKFLRGSSDLKITVNDVLKNGFRAKQTVVTAKENHPERSGKELSDALEDTCASLGLSKEGKTFAKNALRTLIDSESNLHGESPNKVHLHEAGSIDTLVDIIGSASALDELGVFHDTRIVYTPIAVGGGTFTFSHGTVTSPGPAVLEIAKEHRLRIIGGPVEMELTTPTGIAILSSLVQEHVRLYPSMSPIATGFGAGSRDLPALPNVLRLTLGDAASAEAQETIVVLETNLDDIPGEYLSHASELLMDAGAKDVTIVPVIAKKGRPGYLLKVITDASQAESLSELIMRETGTLGVRVNILSRYIADRRVVKLPVSLGGKKVNVSVKVARGANGQLISVKPEYEDVSMLSRKLGIPTRLVYQEVLSQIEHATF